MFRVVLLLFFHGDGHHRDLHVLPHSFPTRRSSDLLRLKARQTAHGLFQRKLAARSQPGKQLESARALFDLWIDAAEEAYAEVALSPEFRKSYGAMVNAQMKLRQAVQGEVEQAAAQMGMPTRTEVDGANHKNADVGRALRPVPARGPDAKKQDPP